MRVLHAISGIDRRYGGPVSAVIGLAEAQVKAGMDVKILTTWCPGTDLSEAGVLRKRGVTVVTVGPCNPRRSQHPDLARIAGESVSAADVVHIHAMWEDVQHLTARAAQAQGVPYVIRPCGMLDPWSFNQGRRWKKRLYLLLRMRRNLERASAIHFMTPMERDATAVWRLRPRPIVEPNGVDLSEFAHLPPRGQFRARFPQIGDRPLVMFLGRLHTGKGLELLIPAFAKVEPREAVLVIAGPDLGGHQEQWDKLIAEHNVPDRVIFTGMLNGPERVAALADADLFALPSFHENFGIAVVEALAAGTPVVVSDGVYLHPEISAAQVGAVVPLQVDPLAAEISRWLGDAPLRRAAAERAKPFVWDRYDWRNIARRWAGHYETMAARRSVAV